MYKVGYRTAGAVSMSILSTAPAIGTERQREKETCTNPSTIIYDMEAGNLHGLT